MTVYEKSDYTCIRFSVESVVKSSAEKKQNVESLWWTLMNLGGLIFVTFNTVFHAKDWHAEVNFQDF